MNPYLAKRLTADVHHFYETQGGLFSATRQTTWEEQRLIARRATSGMTVVDVGAGNGRFARLLPADAAYIGVEPSSALRQAADPDLHLESGSLPSLPLPDAVADLTVCFAVFHHLPALDRAASVAELIRITKPGGLVMATSWFIPENDPRLTPVEGGDPGDYWMPWKADGDLSHRYVHLFTRPEWAALWNHPRLSIEHIGLFGSHDWTTDETRARNWCVMATMAGEHERMC